MKPRQVAKIFGLLAIMAMPFAAAGNQPALTTLKGDVFTLADYRGKSVLINFWATWCGPCRKEMPELSQLADKLDHNKAVVVGMAADEKSEVEAFLKKLPVVYTVTIGDPDQLFAWSTALGNTVQALPFSVLFNEQGDVSWTKMGELDFDELEEVMRSYIKTADVE